MEYVTDHGSCLPISSYDTIINSFFTHYGSQAKDYLNQTNKTGNFEQEAQEEVGKTQTN